MSDPQDVIDHLAGIAPGSSVYEVRLLRHAARENAQKSYEALLQSDNLNAVTQVERLAIAAFVTGLHRDATVAKFYHSRLSQLAEPAIVSAVTDEIRRGETTGPYGQFPAGRLSSEDQKGIIHVVGDTNRRILGDRLTAAFEHAHLLVFRPRDSSSAALQSLLASGWNTDGIVTVSQLVAFLAFQVRVIVGLRALASSATSTATKAA